MRAAREAKGVKLDIEEEDLKVVPEPSAPYPLAVAAPPPPREKEVDYIPQAAAAFSPELGSLA